MRTAPTPLCSHVHVTQTAASSSRKLPTPGFRLHDGVEYRLRVRCDACRVVHAQVDIDITPSYPFEPPKMRFITKVWCVSFLQQKTPLPPVRPLCWDPRNPTCVASTGMFCTPSSAPCCATTSTSVSHLSV